MTTRLNERGINLNTVLGTITIIGVLCTSVFFLAPLKSLPEDMRGVQDDMGDVKRTQAVQTEALKTLADVTKDNRELRRDFDKHSATSAAADQRQDAELEQVKRRLDRVEQR